MGEDDSDNREFHMTERSKKVLFLCGIMWKQIEYSVINPMFIVFVWILGQKKRTTQYLSLHKTLVKLQSPVDDSECELDNSFSLLCTNCKSFRLFVLFCVVIDE